jgi:hypothetical protein
LNHRGIEIHYEENLYLEDKRKVVATFMVLINHGAVEDSGLSEEDREINKLWRVSPGSFLVRMKRLPSDLLGDENFEKTIQGPAALVKGAYYPGMEHHLRVVRTDLKMNDKERNLEYVLVVLPEDKYLLDNDATFYEECDNEHSIPRETILEGMPEAVVVEAKQFVSEAQSELYIPGKGKGGIVDRSYATSCWYLSVKKKRAQNFTSPQQQKKKRSDAQRARANILASLGMKAMDSPRDSTGTNLDSKKLQEELDQMWKAETERKAAHATNQKLQEEIARLRHQQQAEKESERRRVAELEAVRMRNEEMRRSQHQYQEQLRKQQEQAEMARRQQEQESMQYHQQRAAKEQEFHKQQEQAEMARRQQEQEAMQYQQQRAAKEEELRKLQEQAEMARRQQEQEATQYHQQRAAKEEQLRREEQALKQEMEQAEMARRQQEQEATHYHQQRAAKEEQLRREEQALQQEASRLAELQERLKGVLSTNTKESEEQQLRRLELEQQKQQLEEHQQLCHLELEQQKQQLEEHEREVRRNEYLLAEREKQFQADAERHRESEEATGKLRDGKKQKALYNWEDDVSMVSSMALLSVNSDGLNESDPDLDQKRKAYTQQYSKSIPTTTTPVDLLGEWNFPDKTYGDDDTFNQIQSLIDNTIGDMQEVIDAAPTEFELAGVFNKAGGKDDGDSVMHLSDGNQATTGQFAFASGTPFNGADTIPAVSTMDSVSSAASRRSSHLRNQTISYKGM